MSTVLAPGSPVARTLAPVLNPLLPDRKTTVRVLGGPARGLRVVIEPRREKYYWTGGHERDVQAELVRLLCRGATFWDVGAHIGFFSMLAARLVGPAGRVHAFEPLAENRARLVAGIRANGFGHVIVDGRAVAAVDGEAMLHRHDSTLMWTLVEGLGDGAGHPVPCTTLDTLASELGVPDVVKIDAEGAELDVLAAARGLLANGRTAFLLETRDVDRLAAIAPNRTIASIGPKHAVVA
jgi:FkbM family methyltransferase